MIRCSSCKKDSTVKQDPAPIFEISSDRYIVRQQSCYHCKVPNAKKGDRRQNKSRMFYPVDKRPFIRMGDLGKDPNAPKKKQVRPSRSKAAVASRAAGKAAKAMVLE